MSRSLFRRYLSLFVLLGAVTLVTEVLIGVMRRYQEYRADAFAARYLGDVNQVIDSLQSMDESTLELNPDGGEHDGDLLGGDSETDISFLASTHGHPSERR